MEAIITLTTDFGLADPYVGAMKGAILSVNPRARLIDITHLVEPGDVLGGAFVLAEAARFFPPGAIHVAVVDPGVGTKRRPILIESGGSFYVGPDNGLLSVAAFDAKGASKAKAYRLKEKKFFNAAVSATFHGRDIFGPVAARLSLGAAPEEFGPRINDAVRLRLPRPSKGAGRTSGVVVRVDSFGNLITNIRPDDLPKSRLIEVRLPGGVINGISRTYGSVPEGRAAAIIGSAGLLEIAVNGGSAAKLYNASAGTRVVIKVTTR